jgi:hypothetical protein
MRLDIAAALREPAHRVTETAAKAVMEDVKRELASVAFALARLDTGTARAP